jgi:hypothetical protein
MPAAFVRSWLCQAGPFGSLTNHENIILKIIGFF